MTGVEGYTPTTEEVRAAYAMTDFEQTQERYFPEFDLWLLSERARIWDEANEELTAFFESGLKGHFENVARTNKRKWVAEPRPVNPYRKSDSA